MNSLHEIVIAAAAVKQQTSNTVKSLKPGKISKSNVNNAVDDN